MATFTPYSVDPLWQGTHYELPSLWKRSRRRVSAPCPPHAKRRKFLSRRHSIWVSLVEIGGWKIYRTVDCSLPLRGSRFPTWLRSTLDRSHHYILALWLALLHPFSLLKQDILSRLPFRSSYGVHFHMFKIGEIYSVLLLYWWSSSVD